MFFSATGAVRVKPCLAPGRRALATQGRPLRMTTLVRNEHCAAAPVTRPRTSAAESAGVVKVSTGRRARAAGVADPGQKLAARGRAVATQPGCD